VTTITLQARNPLDPRPEDLEDLAQSIRNLDADIKVVVAVREPPAKGVVGVTWVEVIECYVPWSDAKDVGVAALTIVITEWLRKRFIKVPKRPKSVTIYGPSGESLKQIKLESPTDQLGLRGRLRRIFKWLTQKVRSKWTGKTE
jgi:hypothetical protein